MRYRLPSLNAVRALEAAVRRRSLTAASRELQVTPGAVSRHVALLEAQFHCELLVREPQGGRPTEKGQNLFEAVSKAMDGIDAASRALSAESVPPHLVVQLYTALAVDWLSPRLEAFTAPTRAARFNSSPR